MKNSELIIGNVIQWKNYFITLNAENKLSGVKSINQDLILNSSWLDIMKESNLSSVEIISHWKKVENKIGTWGEQGELYLNSLPFYSWVSKIANSFLAIPYISNGCYFYIAAEKDSPGIKVTFHKCAKFPILEFQIPNSEIAKELNVELATLFSNKNRDIAALICILFVDE